MPLALKEKYFLQTSPFIPVISFIQIAERFFGNIGKGAGVSVQTRKRGRTCRIEELESRELLSVSPLHFGCIEVPYGDIEDIIIGPPLTFTFDTNDLQKIDNIGLTSEDMENPDVVKWEVMGVEGGYVNRLIELRVAGKNIANLDLSGCTALKVLDCGSNPLTTLNLSGCASLQTLNVPVTTLKVLSITGNGLATQTLSDLTALEELHLCDAALTRFDISANSALKHLYLENFKIGSWDITDSSLTSLSLNNCQLTTLKASGNTTLEGVCFVDTQLATMDAAGCTALKSLSLIKSQLVTLTTVNCTVLTDLNFTESLVSVLNCSNNKLSVLDLSGCTTLQTLNCSGNFLSFAAVMLPVNGSGTVTFGTQQSLVPITLGPGNIADLSNHYLGGKTTFVWKNAENDAVVTPKSSTGGVFTFTNLPSDTVFYCEMTNTDFPGATLKTTEVTMGVITLITLAPPVNVTGVEQETKGTVRIEWVSGGNHTPGTTVYEVKYSIDGLNWYGPGSGVTITVASGGRGTTASVTGLSAGTYKFQVIASETDKVSSQPAISDDVPVEGIAETLASPANVEVIAKSASQLKVSWTGDSNADGYIIEVYTNRAFSGEPVSTKTVEGGVTETVIDDLESGTLYFVRVIAKGNGATTADSEASASTDKNYAAPIAAVAGGEIIAVVVDAADATNSVTLDFGNGQDTLDALKNCVIQYSDDGGVTWKDDWIIPPNTGQITVSGLEENKSYTFRLKSIDGSIVTVKTVDSGGLEKTTVTAGTQATLTAPKKPSVKIEKKLTSLESITLDFGGIKAPDMTNMDTFNITYAAVPKGVKWENITDKITIIVPKAALENGRYYTFIGLRSDTKYQFDVTAKDANGKPAMNKNTKVTSMTSVKGATAKFVAIKGSVAKKSATISSVTMNLTLPASYAVPEITGWTAVAKSKPIYGFENDPSVGFTMNVLRTAKKTSYDPGGLHAKSIKNWEAIEPEWSWKIKETSPISSKGVVTVVVEITGLPKAGTKYMVVVNAVQGAANESVAGRINIATAKYDAVKKVKLERNGTPGKKADDFTQIFASWTLPGKMPSGATYHADDYSIYLVYTSGSGVGKVWHEVLVDAEFTSATTATIDVVNFRTLLSENGLDITKKQNLVLRASTDGVESADAKFSIILSKIANLVSQ